jgi:PPOX class probable F420-dependent enzyme
MNVASSEVEAFLSANHRAILATIRRNGMPQLTNVAQAHLNGRIEISTRAPSAKVTNIRRDPRVTISVQADDNWYRYLVVYGSAQIIEYPEAGERLREIYREIAGEHPNWSEFDEAMVNEQRVVLSVTIERIAG